MASPPRELLPRDLEAMRELFFLLGMLNTPKCVEWTNSTHPCAAELFLAPTLRRNLASASARFGESNRDRLLATLHFLSRATALQFPALHLVHGAFDFGGCFFSVAWHLDVSE